MLNVLIFYAMYGAGLLAGLFRNPVYTFSLYEAVYFFSPHQRWWGSMIPDVGYSFFVVVFMIGMLCLNHKQAKQNKLFQIPQFRWMYLLLFLYSVAYFYAVLPESHLEASITFLKLVITISVAYKLCDTDTKLDYVLYGYVFGAWYIGFLAFQTGRNSGDRLEGIGTTDAPDSNGIAAAIAPCLVLCLYYFWTGKSWLSKGLVVIAGAFIANGLILINSRGAFLGAGASLAYFMLHMYFSSFQRKFQKSMAIFITVTGLAGAGLIMDETFLARINTFSGADTELNEDQETGATRIFFWKAAWEMAKDHPFGAGNRAFEYYAPFYVPAQIDTGHSRNRAVHSTWFENLSEAGYLSLLTFTIMLYSAHRTLIKCKKELRKTNRVDEYFKMIAVQAALLAFIVAMTFINRMRAEILYWLILYTACAYNIYVLKGGAANSTSSPSINTNLPYRGP